MRLSCYWSWICHNMSKLAVDPRGVVTKIIVPHNLDPLLSSTPAVASKPSYSVPNISPLRPPKRRRICPQSPLCSKSKSLWAVIVLIEIASFFLFEVRMLLTSWCRGLLFSSLITSLLPPQCVSYFNSTNYNFCFPFVEMLMLLVQALPWTAQLSAVS